MQKNTVLVLLVVVLAIAAAIGVMISNNKEAEEALTVVRLNEVVHSIFYAPQYVALEMGFFEEEGLLIELSVGQGADKSMVSLISGNADIALMGTEAAVYVYNEGKEDYAVSFAQLTQRAGNYVVSRTDDRETFSWSDVQGKTIVGGRNGGMPQMLLEYILYQNGIVPSEDVDLVTNLQFSSTAGAFIGGIGDYTIEFDPSAHAIEQTGAGFIIRSLALDSDVIPYTVYMAQKSYIEANPEIIQKFTNAIYKGQKWFEEHSSQEIAELIHPQFSENTVEDLVIMIERYREQEVFNTTPAINEEGFYLLQDIMDLSGELSARVPFEDLVNNSFAEKALQIVD